MLLAFCLWVFLISLDLDTNWFFMGSYIFKITLLEFGLFIDLIHFWRHWTDSELHEWNSLWLFVIVAGLDVFFPFLPFFLTYLYSLPSPYCPLKPKFCRGGISCLPTPPAPSSRPPLCILEGGQEGICQDDPRGDSISWFQHLPCTDKHAAGETGCLTAIAPCLPAPSPPDGLC